MHVHVSELNIQLAYGTFNLSCSSSKKENSRLRPLPRRRVDPTGRPVHSLLSAPVHVKTRSLALERSSSRVEWLMNDDGEVEALGSLVSRPLITQQYFVGMLQARIIDQVDVYFPFRMAKVLPLRTAWIVDILSQASLQACAMYNDNAVGGVVAEQRLSLWYYDTTERSFTAVDKPG